MASQAQPGNLDGGYTGAAAWTLEPYKGQPGYHDSGPLIDEAGLLEISRAAHERGWQMTFEEDEKGSLEVGKRADLVVLSQDLLTIDPARTMDTEVDLTVLGGRVVHER